MRNDMKCSTHQNVPVQQRPRQNQARFVAKMGDGGGLVAVIDLLEAATPQQDAGGRDEPAHAMGEAVNDTAIQQRSPTVRRKHLAPRRPPSVRLVEPDHDMLRAFSGLYSVYYDALRKEMWHVCALKPGRLVYPSVKYVPPCLAMTFLTDLAEAIGAEVEVDDDKGRSSILYSVKVISMEDIGRCCYFEEEDPKKGFRQYRLVPRGAVAFVAALRVEFYQSRLRTGVHRLEFVGTVWRLKPHGDLRPGTALTVPVNKYLQAACHAKRSVIEMPVYLRERLPQTILHWAGLPLVDPVSRSDMTVEGGSMQFIADELTPEQETAKAKKRHKLIASLRAKDDRS